MTIKDAAGKEVKVGDKVAFGQAGRGAQEFETGIVVKVTDKGIKIEQEYFNKWVGTIGTQEYYRVTKAFVVIE